MSKGERVLAMLDEERQDILLHSQQVLWMSAGDGALEYLRNSRGLSDDVIREYQLGYMPPDMRKPFSPDRHELAGRIVIPIIDELGRLIAMSSRDYRPGASLKFWHESFNKSRYLYGMNLAWKHMASQNEAILVEGEFDAMYLRDNGIKNVAAVMSASMTWWHVAMLCRFCSRIVMLFDGDKHGVTHAIEGHELFNRRRAGEYGCVQLLTATLPSTKDDQDPDDFIKKHGTDALKAIIAEAR